MVKENTKVCEVSDKVLEQLQKDIAEIKIALLGNEYNPTSGLISRMSEVEQENIKLRNKLDRIVWTAGGAAFVLSFLFNVFMIWFNKIILG